MTRVSRRAFLGASAAFGALVACSAEKAPSTYTVAFHHGVASGDPARDAVILWSRVTATAKQAYVPIGDVPVSWQIAADRDFEQIVQQGNTTAFAHRDHTVKVDVQGLQPATQYFYRFVAQDIESPVGRTKTLPVGAVTGVRFAVTCCANFPFGFFNAYGNVARRDDLAAVLHLGDYLYEYGHGEYGGGDEIDRVHLPRHSLVTLADYRRRHAQYKTDPDLQAAHARHPWITVWDDHEVANDASAEGAENHHPDNGDGSWLQRKAAAIRAYLEWMPIREQAEPARIFRHFAFGDLLDLIMLDTRLYGRIGRNLNAREFDAVLAPNRTLLGTAQSAWLTTQLRGSMARSAAWRLIGQQTMVAQFIDPAGSMLNTDQWDGFPNDRARLLEQIEMDQIKDVVFLSGDIHSSWALDIAKDPFGSYDRSNGTGALALELVAPPVTSPSPFGEGEIAQRAQAHLASFLPHAQFMNLDRRGYLLVDVDRERVQGEWYFVDRVDQRSTNESLGGRVHGKRGESHWRVVR